MTGSTTVPIRDTATRATENREYVRRLLQMRQPQFAAALESAVQDLLRDQEAA